MGKKYNTYGTCGDFAAVCGNFIDMTKRICENTFRMLINYLQKTFAEKCKRNPRYSLRAYAKSLDLDSSTLSALLRRKRPLTAKMAQKLIAKLDIESTEQAQLLLLSSMGTEIGSSEGPSYETLEQATAEIIASWEHFAILAALEMKRFKADIRSLSKRLNIPHAVVRDCLTRLEQQGFVQEKNETWFLAKKNMGSPSNVPSSALRQAHRQTIQKAMESLEKDPLDVRDISGMTMAIDRKKINEARKLIQNFRRRLSHFLEEGDSNSVYRLNIQLFPLSEENNL